MGASICNPRTRARFVYQPVDWFRVIVELKKNRLVYADNRGRCGRTLNNSKQLGK